MAMLTISCIYSALYIEHKGLTSNVTRSDKISLKYFKLILSISSLITLFVNTIF